jgi:hypothetical protein
MKKRKKDAIASLNEQAGQEFPLQIIHLSLLVLRGPLAS